MSWKGGLYDALPPPDSKGEDGADVPIEEGRGKEAGTGGKKSTEGSAQTQVSQGDVAGSGIKPSGWGSAAFAPSSLRPRQTTQLARKGVGGPAEKKIAAVSAPVRKVAVQPLPLARIAQSTQLLGGIISGAADEYDPYHPNEYAVVVRRLEKEKTAQRRVAAQLSGRGSARSLPEAPVQDKPNVAQKNLSGEEVFLRRARLSAAASSESAVSTREKPRGAGEDVARRMLMNMGWREGQGLGRGVEGHKPVQQKSSAVAPIDVARDAEELRSVVLLRNMVGPGEADASLRAETAEECAKYGAVRQCEVVEVSAAPPGEAVRIFVDFVDPAAAERAVRDLNGRFFGGRTVKACLYTHRDMPRPGTRL